MLASSERNHKNVMPITHNYVICSSANLVYMSCMLDQQIQYTKGRFQEDVYCDQ